MPEIFSGTNDGFVGYFLVDSWADARSATNGTQFSSTLAFDADAVAVKFTSGRGSTVPQIFRAFFEFDTSGISVAPSAATLKIYGSSFNEGDVIAVRSTQDGTLSTDDFAELHNCSTELGNSNGSGAGSLASVSGLTYSSEISTWSTSGYNDITLNSTALNDMASLDTFKVALINYDHDYLDIASVGSTPLVRNGMVFANNSGTSFDPKIDYTAGTATGYGHAVIGVSSANIANVKGVANANIKQVIGVEAV